MGFSVVPLDQVDIPFADLQAKQPDIEQFSASTIIFCSNPRDSSKPYVALYQRAHWDHTLGKANSWGGSWETCGGGHDSGARYILDTAIRETREESNLHVSYVSRHVYVDTVIHKAIPTARYTFCVNVVEELRPQRIWCDEQQGPVGTEGSDIKLNPDEHSDFCWATEEQVRYSIPYQKENPRQDGLVMVVNRKEVILDAFERLNNSQLDMIDLIERAEKPSSYLITQRTQRHWVS